MRLLLVPRTLVGFGALILGATLDIAEGLLVPDVDLAELLDDSLVLIVELLIDLEVLGDLDPLVGLGVGADILDRKSTRLNSSHS